MSEKQTPIGIYDPTGRTTAVLGAGAVSAELDRTDEATRDFFDLYCGPDLQNDDDYLGRMLADAERLDISENFMAATILGEPKVWEEFKSRKNQEEGFGYLHAVESAIVIEAHVSKLMGETGLNTAQLFSWPDKHYNDIKQTGWLGAVAENIEIFLKHGIDPQTMYNDLKQTGWLGFAENIEILLKHGIDPQTTYNDLKQTGRLGAVAENIEIFLKHGIDPQTMYNDIKQTGRLDAVAENIEIFLKHGIDPQTMYNDLKQTGWLGFAENIEIFLKHGIDPQTTYNDIKQTGRLGAVAKNIEIFLKHGIDPQTMYNDIKQTGRLGAVAKNIEIFLKHGIDPQTMYNDIKQTGRLGAVAKNIEIFLKHGIDPQTMYNDLKQTGWLGFAENIEIFLKHGIDPQTMYNDLKQTGWLDAVAKNIEILLKHGIDPQTTYNDIKQTGRLGFAENIEIFLKHGIDPQTMYNDLKRTGWFEGVGHKTRIFVKYGFDAPGHLKKDRLHKAIAKSHDLQTDLESLLTIEKCLPDQYKELRVMPDDLVDFCKLNISNYSYDLYEQLYKPVLNGDAKTMAGLEKLNISVGNVESVINQVVDMATRYVAGIVLGGGVFSSAAPVLEVPFARKTILHILRLRRGEWALKNISDQELYAMMADPTNRENMRPATVYREGVRMKNEVAKDVPVSESAMREAQDILGALRAAQRFASEELWAKETIQSISSNLIGKIEKRIANMPEGQGKSQKDSLEARIKTLQSIKYNDDSSEGLDMSELKSIIVTLSQAIDKKDKENRDAIRAMLMSGPVQKQHMPQSIVDLLARVEVEQSQLGAIKLTSDDVLKLSDFLEHHTIQEFWGLSKQSPRSGQLSTLVSKTSAINEWRSADEKRQAKLASDNLSEIQFVASSNNFVRTVAGAMGDACYSQSFSIVPESAEVVTMLDDKGTKILGNFLLLDSKYYDKENVEHKIKVLRAINPLESTLKKFSPQDLLETIFKVSGQLKPEGYELAVIVDDKSNLATTNRAIILHILQQMVGQRLSNQPLESVDRSVNFNQYDSTGRVHLVS